MTVASEGQGPGTPLFNNMDSGLIGAFTDFGFGFYDWHQRTARRSIFTTTTSC